MAGLLGGHVLNQVDGHRESKDVAKTIALSGHDDLTGDDEVLVFDETKYDEAIAGVERVELGGALKHYLELGCTRPVHLCEIVTDTPVDRDILQEVRPASSD